MTRRELTQTALLAAIIFVSGMIKIPSIFPGAEFQLSAPIAVAICAVFGFKKYFIAGLVASLLAFFLGLQNFIALLIALQFRFIVGVILHLGGTHAFILAIAGPIGTLIARLTLSFIFGQAVWLLVSAAIPGMVLTFFSAPFFVKIFSRLKEANTY